MENKKDLFILICIITTIIVAFRVIIFSISDLEQSTELNTKFLNGTIRGEAFKIIL